MEILTIAVIRPTSLIDILIVPRHAQVMGAASMAADPPLTGMGAASAWQWCTVRRALQHET